MSHYLLGDIKDKILFLKNDINSVFLLVLVFIMVIVGAVFVYSASANESFELFGYHNYFLEKQVIFILIGIIAFLAFYLFPIDFFRKYSHIFFIVGLVLMLFVLIPGLGIRSGVSARWIDLGFINLQPSEFLKPFFLLYISAFFASRYNEAQAASRNFKAYIKKIFSPFILILFVMLGAFYMQKDASTYFLLAVSSFFIFLLLKPPVKVILIGVILGALVLFAMVKSESYRSERFQAGAERQDILDEGFQKYQSLVSIGSGGLFGQGIGAGFNKNKVPFAKNDSIFATIGEETGFVGSILVVSLYFMFLLLGLKMALSVEKIFNRMLIYGIVILLSFQAVINIQSALGWVVTGMPLPFISYGGSSIVASFMMVGLLLSSYNKKSDSGFNPRQN